MYGLPKDFDGSMFIGRSVEVVSFTISSVIVSFGNQISITIESSFEHRTRANGNESREVQRVPVKESRLMQLVGLTVETVEVNTNGTLTLNFNEGHVLQCFDDLPNYESYRITHGEEEIYV